MKRTQLKSDPPRLLDLFSGAGGAAMGYSLAGFEVVGVDIKAQPRYPFEFHQGDALEFLAEHGREFDVIHASPVCKRYSECTPIESRDKHPDLIEPCQRALRVLGLPYVIENVECARHLLNNPIMLCGSMFGLRVWKHRYFEVSPSLVVMRPPCDHSFSPVLTVGSGHGKREASSQQKRDAMNTQWMGIRQELRDAIPPAYTEFIGRHLLAALREVA